MSIQAKLALAVTALTLLACLFLAWLRSTRSHQEAPEPVVASGSPHVSLAQIPLDQRQELLPGSSPQENTSMGSSAGQMTAPSIRAQIVDSSLAPVPGAQYMIQVGSREQDSLSDASAPDGSILLELPVDLFEHDVAMECPMGVSAAGFAQWFRLERIHPGENDLGRIVLERCARVRGRVIDESSLPVARARVLATDPGRFFGEKEERRAGPTPMYRQRFSETLSALDGEFQIDDVAPGPVRLWASAEGTLWTITEPMLAEAGGERSGIVLRLEASQAADWILGEVLSPDGLPVVGASVRCSYPGAAADLWETSAQDGGFRLPALGPEPHDLRAADEAGRWPPIVAKSVVPGARVTLRFTAGFRSVQLLVNDDEGRALEHPAVTVFAEDMRHRISSARPARDGPALIIDEPGETFVLEVSAKGMPSRKFGPFVPGELPGRFELRLARQPGMHGTVFRGDQPVAGATVELFRAAEEGELFVIDGFLAAVRPMDVLGAKTDAEGRFSFSPHEAGNYVLRAEHGETAPGELHVDGFEPAVGRADLLIHLTAGGAIEGLVRHPDKELSGVLVAVSRGDGRVFKQRVSVDGRFRFEGLIPGLWNIEALDREPENGRARLGVLPGEGEMPWVCEVFPGRTTYHDLLLAEHTLKGVLIVNGAPAVGWRARLLPVLLQRPPSERATAILDANGSFEVSLPLECKAQLVLEPPASESAVTLRARIELVGGTTEWSFALETGRMVISRVPRVTDFLEAPFLFWQGPNDVHAIKRLQPDANQQSVVEGVPVGEVRILRYLDPRGPWTERSPSETLAATLVAADGTAFVRLP